MPDKGWFSFGGVSSADMINKLYVRKVPNLNRSERKIDVYSVPGRDGDIILSQDAWINQNQTYECYIGDGDAAAAASELAAWLYSLSGYQELQDGWEPDVFRLAYLSNPLDIARTAPATTNTTPTRYGARQRTTICVLTVAGLVLTVQ